VVTTGLLELEDVQSSSQIITTNKPTSSFFTGRMPFLMTLLEKINKGYLLTYGSHGPVVKAMDLQPGNPDLSPSLYG